MPPALIMSLGYENVQTQTDVEELPEFGPSFQFVMLL